jgi:hypothetical protein
MCFPLCVIWAVLSAGVKAASPLVTLALAKGSEIAAVLLTSALLAGPYAAATSTANAAGQAATKATSVSSIAATADSTQLTIERAVRGAPVAAPAVPRVSGVIKACATPFMTVCRDATTKFADATAASVKGGLPVKLPVV